MWIARDWDSLDGDGDIFLFLKEKPILVMETEPKDTFGDSITEYLEIKHWQYKTGSGGILLTKSWEPLPDITWEDGPVEVELKLK